MAESNIRKWATAAIRISKFIGFCLKRSALAKGPAQLRNTDIYRGLDKQCSSNAPIALPDGDTETRWGSKT